MGYTKMRNQPKRAKMNQKSQNKPKKGDTTHNSNNDQTHTHKEAGLGKHVINRKDIHWVF